MVRSVLGPNPAITSAPWMHLEPEARDPEKDKAEKEKGTTENPQFLEVWERIPVLQRHFSGV